LFFVTENPDAENTLDNPNLITPKESSISIEGNTLNTEIGAMTFAVYKFKKESK
jgi:alpha-L-arabinofuranosidase